MLSTFISSEVVELQLSICILAFQLPAHLAELEVSYSVRNCKQMWGSSNCIHGVSACSPRLNTKREGQNVHLYHCTLTIPHDLPKRSLSIPTPQHPPQLAQSTPQAGENFVLYMSLSQCIVATKILVQIVSSSGENDQRFPVCMNLLATMLGPASCSAVLNEGYKDLCAGKFIDASFALCSGEGEPGER